MACNLLEMYIVLSLSTCCVFTHLILIIWKSVMFIAFVYVCVFENINKLNSGTRAHQNTWGRVSQAWKRYYERDEEVWHSCSIWGSGMDAGVCTDKHWQFQCKCAVVFPAERSEQIIMTSLCDVTRISHAIGGGNYKKRAWPSLGGCHNYHLGVLVLNIWVY